jgi:hypothetical protein
MVQNPMAASEAMAVLLNAFFMDAHTFFVWTASGAHRL